MYILALASIPGFYVSQELHSSEPIVILREKHVLDANGSALKRVVALGMGKAEARSLMDGKGEMRQWDRADFEAQQEAFLDELARFSNVVEPVDQHEAFLDLSDHPNTLKTVGELRARLEKILSLDIKLGIGPVRWIARQAAEIRPFELEPLYHPRRFARSLSVSSLPVDSLAIARLRRLGCRSIADVAGISLDMLSRQFGDLGYTIALAAQGSGNSQVRPLYPPASAASSFSFEGGTEDSEVIGRGLRVLSDHLGADLLARDLLGHDLVLSVETDTDRHSITRTFAKPICDPQTIYVALGLLSSELPKQPVLAIQARLLKLKRADTKQMMLTNPMQVFGDAANADIVMARLNDTLGAGLVIKGQDVALPRYKALRSLWRAQSGWNWT